MALVYFDASAFVKLLLEEDGSDVAAHLWDGCDAAVSSRLSHPEVRAALAAAHRSGDLRRADRLSAEATWADYWGGVRPVEFTEQVERHAGDLAAQHGLRGADAVHLASALAIGDGGLVIAVWDRRLHAGAVAAGLTVAPAKL